MRRECLGERRGRGDRVPGAHRRAAIDRAQRRRVVTADEYAITDLVAVFEPQPDRAIECTLCPVAPEMQRVQVRLDQRVLAAELLADQLLDRRHIHVEQRRQDAEIDDVLEQLPLPCVIVGAVADLCQRRADYVMSSRNREAGIGLVESYSR